MITAASGRPRLRPSLAGAGIGPPYSKTWERPKKIGLPEWPGLRLNTAWHTEPGPAQESLGRGDTVVQIVVPGILAAQAEGVERFDVEAATMGEALRALPVADLLFTSEAK